MRRTLTIIQFALGLYFLIVGATHFVVPEGLPAQMGWMYALSPTLHWISGSVEILAGLVLVGVPLVRRYAHLVPLAATGLTLTMIGAIVWHLGRGEMTNIVQNIFLGSLAAFLAYQRWKVRPLRFG